MRTDQSKKALPSALANPAQRALASAGIKHLEDLTRFSEAEVMDLHGIGPNAMRILQEAMTEQDLRFQAEDVARS